MWRGNNFKVKILDFSYPFWRLATVCHEVVTQNCNQTPQTICHEIPREVCKENCNYHNQIQQCSNIPREVCSNLPKKVIYKIYWLKYFFINQSRLFLPDETCWPLYLFYILEVCSSVPRLECSKIPKTCKTVAAEERSCSSQVCSNVPKQTCQVRPKEDCQENFGILR